MIIEILKVIEKSIGIEFAINFLCLICGIGIGGAITDAVYSWKGKDNETKGNIK